MYFVKIRVHLNHYPNWQEIENFLKLKKLIKRKLCDFEDLVLFNEPWLYWIVFFCKRACLSLKRVSSRGSERFVSCFCLSSKLDSISFILVLCAGTLTMQVWTLNPSPPLRYKRAVGSKIQALRLHDILCDFCLSTRLISISLIWNASHWGSVLSYDYVLKLIVIIMKLSAWLLWLTVTEISSVLGWN